MSAAVDSLTPGAGSGIPSGLRTEMIAWLDDDTRAEARSTPTRERLASAPSPSGPSAAPIGAAATDPRDEQTAPSAPSNAGSVVTRYVDTEAIKVAVAGREAEIFIALNIPWTGRAQHITCPYPGHDDHDPSWRWDQAAAKAFCTCINRSDSIFDVLMKVESIDFEAAKIEVAKMIGRSDLIRPKGKQSHGGAPRYLKQDIVSLLNVSVENRDDSLVWKYLGNRLGVAPDQVPRPLTSVRGIKKLGYFHPKTEGGKSVHMADRPCAVFETKDRANKQHGHKIYLEEDGSAKAEVPEPKKSCKKMTDESIAGRSVIWGDPEQAPHAIVAEGIETAAAIAFVFDPEIKAGSIAVFAAISASGVSAFKPWTATKTLTVAADRDEKPKAEGKDPSHAGENCARNLAMRLFKTHEVKIALPGAAESNNDWLDLLRSDDAKAVRDGILGVEVFVPTEDDIKKENDAGKRADAIKQAYEKYPISADFRHFQYAHTRDGKIWIHRKNESKDGPEWHPIISPFGVTARLRMANRDDDYGLRIVVEALNGDPRVIDVRRSDLGGRGATEIVEQLFAKGLRTLESAKKILVAILEAAHPLDEIVTVSLPGWHHHLEGFKDPIFVTPAGQVFGAPAGSKVELTVNVRLSPFAARAGTFEDWRSAIAVAATQKNCPHWVLGIIGGFAAPLLKISRFETCGINLSGQSSSGKTLALQIAASAWATPNISGGRGLIQSFSATANSVEALAQKANGSILALDEMAHQNGKDVGKIIYVIAGGAGKSRLNSESDLRQSRTWSTFAMLSSEKGLKDKVESEDGTWQAGMAVRFTDIDVTDVNRQVSQEQITKIRELDKNHGWAGPAFVEALVKNGLHQDPKAVRELIEKAASKLAGDVADGARIRSALPLATLKVAGDLAKEYRILPKDLDVEGAINWAWGKFSASDDAQALKPEEVVRDNLSQWILEGWDTTIKPNSGGRESSRDAKGWYNETIVYILTKHIVEATGGALKPELIGKTLAAKGWLADRDSDRLTVKYVPLVGPGNCYAISREHFGRPAAIQSARHEPAPADGHGDDLDPDIPF